MGDCGGNQVCSASAIVENLLRHLTDKQQVVDISLQFSTLQSNADRVSFAYRLLNDAGFLPALVVDLKNNALSAAARQKGNEMFKVRKNTEAITHYTEAIALAEDGSEQLALAYANRSAVLFEKGFYQESLMDIDRASKSNYPENLKSKLVSRQHKANQLKLKQLPLNHHESIPCIPENQRNTLIQSASDSIELKTSQEQGRHIVATKDISPGEIIAIEEPFSSILIEEFYTHCHECLKLCYNLIPCTSCTQTLYCSEECRDNAKHYHVFECFIMATIRKLELDKLKLLPLKIVLPLRNQYTTLNECYNVEDDFYRSDRYTEIHNLVSNTSSRSVSDLFDRSVTSAIIFHLMKSVSNFFLSEDDETTFKELVLLHMQTGACNFHEISELAENKDGIYEPREIGAGAYSFLSMFNHRCSANVIRNCYGSTIVVRAIEVIKKGEQCYDNYGYHHAVMTKAERQAKLKKQYFFDCSCDVCENDWPLYVNLPSINTKFQVKMSDVEKLSDGDIDAAKRIIEETLPILPELEIVKPNWNLASLQEMIKQCFGLLGNIRKTL